MVSAPRLLDLFCGQGGAAKGYQRAGFEVIGVDLADHAKRYPGEFVQMDALKAVAQVIAGVSRYEFAAIHASPPCQGYSIATAGNPAARSKHRRLIAANGMPLVLDRHRLFESNVRIDPAGHPKHGDEQVAGVYGGSRRSSKPNATPADDRYAARYERKGGYVPRSKRVQQELLGIDWMTVKGMQESIPPAYSEWIGHQLIAHIRGEAAA